MDFKISDRFIPGKIERLHHLLPPLQIFPYIKCKIKMLIVSDYGDSFGNASFGLTAFLRAFDDPLPYTSFDITTANRRADPTADLQSFKFNTHNLSQYDVIFLFGIERPATRPGGSNNEVSVAELKSISQYMDNGGGMFATGDHEDLGVDMCGRIPRIRSMRRWYTPANPGPLGEPFAPMASGGQNHDTVVDTDNVTPGNQGSQSDLVPQKIKPVYKYGFASPGYNPHYLFNYVKYPHPVLCSPDGVIKVLPDHMHEGLCEVPSNLTRSFTFNGYTTEEYPIVGSSRLKPKVIAKAHDNVSDSDFGVIATYDGHEHSSYGRVLVDATWHHFFNINIKQFQDLKDLVDGGGYTPSAAEVSALKDYNFIQHYFRNIAYWLAGRSKQSCFRIRGWIWILNHTDIQMNFRNKLEKVRKFDKVIYFHTLGVLAKNALGDLQSQCQSSGLIMVVQELLPLKKITPMIKKESFSFIDPEMFETVCLGCTLHNLNDAMKSSKKKISEKKMEEIIEESSFDGANELLNLVGSSVSTFRRRLKKAKYKKK